MLDFRLIEEFFNPVLIRGLIDTLDQAGVRKLETNGDFSRYPVLAEAARSAEARLGLPFNASVLKRYSVEDEHVSGAYEAHRDPEQYWGSPMCLVTLAGEATLRYWDDESGAWDIACRENLAVILRPDLVHQVSPPTGPSGVRYLLFLGVRHSDGTS